MPARNVVKTYAKDTFYHIYNRGVEKRNIFQDPQDYKVFLNYIKEHLSLPNPQGIKFKVRGKSFKGIPRLPKNYQKEIDLIAYCLMPNHFHLLVKQHEKDSMEKLLRSLATRYSMYFNKKYERVGSLFQGPYKAAHIKDDIYLLYLTKYIHLNPVENTSNLLESYSSYSEYLGIRKTPWIKTDFVLDFFNKSVNPEFKKIGSYQNFVENFKKDSHLIPSEFTID